MSVEKESVEQLSPVKKALLTIEKLQQELDAREKAPTEPIAIIGMGCRFPGADNPQAFWQLLSEGREAIREVPGDRFNLAEFYDPDPETPGKMYMRRGGFLQQIDGFDAQFFRISPREAAQMDPQQRLFLEVCLEALDDAGQPIDKLSGSQTGVFVGVLSNDYAHIPANLSERIDAYYYQGINSSFIAGRLSYFLGLHGQSITIDTACSSSLVAVHLACQSLRARESDLAITGGVNLILSPEISIFLSKAKALSPTGCCRAFDRKADGMVRGEGCGVVVLKRLKDAIDDGDPVLAVIRGSAVNHDGASGGLTVPNPRAQELLYRAALKNARIDPNDVSYIEAHGTGTHLGDPVELHGLAAAFCATRALDHPLWIGSVKTNIGHTDSAAGIAGLIKTALVLQHNEIPPSLHFDEPNPEFRWEKFPIAVANRRICLPEKDSSQIAGVSSFGLSGMNAHVLLQAFKSPPVTSRLENNRRVHLLAISAKTPAALRHLAVSYREFFTGAAAASLHDICSTAATRRSHFEHRLAVVGQSREEMAEHLNAFLQNHVRPAVASRQTAAAEAPGIAFVFSGQGSQWPGMGRELLKQEIVFRKKLEEIDEIFYRESGWSILRELNADESSSRIHDTEVAQPAIFALQLALTALWQHWGIRAQAVVGHSMGEVAAAHVAGVLALKDAVRVIYHRSRLMQKATGTGKMAAVRLPFDAAQRLVSPHAHRVCVAASNSPVTVVLSGEELALETILAELREKGIFYQKLDVNYAFHSPQMEPYQKELESALQGLPIEAPGIPVFSTVTGRIAVNTDFNAAYWAKNIREPVLFAEAIDELIREHFSIFLELSPHPVLGGNIRQCLDSHNRSGLVVHSLHRDKGEEQGLLESLGALYANGSAVEFRQLYRDGRCVTLPNYPWQRERHWLKAGADRDQKPTSPPKPWLHPLLGQRYRSAMQRGEIEFESYVSQHAPGFLEHYHVYQIALLPPTAYLEMALAAGAAVFKSERLVLEDVVFQQALELPENESKTVHCVLTPENSDASFFQVFSLTGAEENEESSWTLHASGKVFKGRTDPEFPQTELAALQAQVGEQLSVDDHYEQARNRGVDCGPSFRAIERLWRAEGEALGQLRLPETLVLEAGDYKLHPVLLDACFQLLWAALPHEFKERLFLPVGLGALRMHPRPGTSLWCYVRLHPINGDRQNISADLRLFEPDGRTIAEIDGLRLKQAHREELFATTKDFLRKSLYEVEWRAQVGQGRKLPADYLPSPAEIGDAVKSQLAQLISQPDLEKYGEVLAQLKVLSVDYILQAFTHMGMEFLPGQSFSTPHLAKQVGVISRYHRLLGRCLEILAEEQILRQAGEQWTVLLAPKIRNPEEQIGKLINKYPGAESELALLGRCGASLAQVLRGRCDPLELLFPKGDLTAATKLFHDSTWARASNAVVQGTVMSALKRLPHGRQLRVLEIGAGTGSTTSYLLPHLPADQTEYVFTDVSALFLARAREKFGDYPFVRYQQLDIEHAPETQGFPSYHYDIVVAANVLHATTDLRATLQNVQQLLAVGGILVLLEVTAPQRWIDLTFGLTEGWWRFADYALRPTYPLLSATQWRHLLKQVGFKTVATVPLVQESDGNIFDQTVLVAQGDQATAEETLTGPKSWIIFADAQGVGQHLAALLRSTKEVCILVFTGREYEQIGAMEFKIDPASPADFQRLLRETARPDRPPLCGLVHLWSLDLAGRLDWTAFHLGEATEKGCGSALHIMQALVGGGFSHPPSLWLVTRGAQPVGPTLAPLSVEQAPLWGLGRVMALEHPELWGGLVDLDGAANIEAAATQLCREIMGSDCEEQIAYRGAERHVARLVRSIDTEIVVGSMRCRSDATYLITGGLGTLGLKLASWLAERGARYLLLVGRTGLPARSSWSTLAQDSRLYSQIAAVRSIEQLGATVSVVSADVSDVTSMSALFEQFGSALPPLRGVIHAAAKVATPRRLQDIDIGALQKEFGPKATGAWVLHELTRDVDLDFFILFSSAASIWGSKGLAHYAAANHFLDGLAHYRRALGFPALCVNWGWWRDTKAAADLEELFERLGLKTMPPVLALDALEYLLSARAVQKTVAEVDWNLFKPIYEARGPRPFLQEIRPGQQQDHIDSHQPTEFRSLLEQAPANQRWALLRTHVKREVARVLGLDPSQPLDPDLGFFQMGMDSLMSVELRGRLANSLASPLPPTVAFDYPTINALTRFVAGEIVVLEPPRAFKTESGVESVDKTTGESDLVQLSQSEVGNLLDAELEALGELIPAGAHEPTRRNFGG